MMIKLCKALLLVICLPLFSCAQNNADYVKENYNKIERYITMRDGVKLFTSIYIPKDASANQKYPVMMQRTCYSVAPYGEDKMRTSVGPSESMMKEKYIFVYQDVRGRWMSEGTWTNMTPVIDNKKSKKDVDEGSDTYDTIDWLTKNLPFNNGKVGQWGISYPGYYTAAGLLSGHPALKASSPQAPISDFFFDDFHHNGAFIQAYFFTFPVFGVQKTENTSKPWYQMLDAKTKDGYQFGMDLGPLKNAQQYYKDNFFWQETIDHPNYDEFWQKRNLLPHLKNIKPAVMTVGGWFDAEDLRGPLAIYKTIEKNNPGIYNTIVEGPFGHGRWSRETGHTMHNDIYFGDSIATYYQKNIEAKFFNHFLKGVGDGKTGLPEAYLFDTGAKEWKSYDQWPAKNAEKVKFYLNENGALAKNTTMAMAARSFESDPMKPVPYTNDITTTMGFTPFNYMSEDQRFAGRRPDVLVYETEVLENDMVLGGEILAKLNVSTTGTDADWVVKLIDVYPANEPNNNYMPNKNITLSNYWQMVRSEVMRGRFRNSFEKPEPFVANQPTTVNIPVQDVLHTFKKGHKIMVQIQSTWFPLIDRNPQKYVDNIFKAEQSDFIKATHKVFNNSYIEVEVLK
ncbi:CocE/NonD family hydrolase [Pedobacter cryophilus]|uniref:CocE/NonD family hydrolase n=1 Tax=Pedobacter cryophilus TaxID=2571271 RepID=A0A4U1BVR7_9SPHI|nr:CocE/NonD family hydrolase [Pedobacter cryophilus]TKB96284.1 CocE/NonD family hydrolase [Pedobacter cryophilus]